MRHTDYGKKINKCFHAIIQLYSDCSKLLTDCDRLFPPDKSMYGSEITRGLSRAINSPNVWLPFGLYRYWYLDQHNCIGGEGLAWSLWDTVLEEDNLPIRFGEVFENKPPPIVYERIDKISFCVEPLYTIEEIADVKKLFKKCGVYINDERAK